MMKRLLFLVAAMLVCWVHLRAADGVGEFPEPEIEMPSAKPAAMPEQKNSFSGAESDISGQQEDSEDGYAE